MTRPNSAHYILVVFIALGIAVLALSFGTSRLSMMQIWASLTQIQQGAQSNADIIIQQIRLPRILLGFTVGALLGLAGSSIQGLFRNPLAEPGLLGVSTGATLSAMAVLILFPGVFALTYEWLGGFTLPVFAFVGAALSTFVVLAIQGTQSASTTTMILAGVAVNIVAGAGISLCAYLATDEQLRTLTFWGLGSLGSANWTKATIAVMGLLVCWPLLWRCYRPLNALLLGESEARHLGFNVRRLKILVILLVALAVGTAVAFCGIIGFVGLVIPHIVRMIFGPDHRHVIPLSTLLGGILLVLSDLFARVVIAPAEIPVGVVTAAIGGPFFIFLLVRNRRVLL